jgi:hypothetical protein
MAKWDDFIVWARKFREWPGFDADERDYKLNLAKRLAAARDLFRSGAEGWVGELRGALTSKDNNFTNWRVHSPFIDWMESSSAEAGEAVSHLWNTPEPIRDSVEAFAEKVQLPAKAGKSGLITLASVLLGGVDMLGLPIHEHTDVAPRHVLDAAVPPRRQDLVLEDATLLGPAALLLSRLLVQVVERSDSVAVRRALVLFLCGRVGIIEDTVACANRFVAGLSQLAIGIAAERQPTEASVIAVQEHPGLVPAGRHANREAWRQRVEHFVTRASGLQSVDRSNGEILRGHDLRLPVSRAEGFGVTPG